MRVDGVDVVIDIGKSINPGINRGQIAGAFFQGMGWMTNEELKYTDKGNLLNYSPTTYKIPNIQDLPERFNIETIDNYNTPNVRGTKAVGEPPLLLGISVFAAVKNALSFISGDEIPCLTAPATNEEILGRIMYYETATADAKNDARPAAPTGWTGDSMNGTSYSNEAGMLIPTIKHGALRPVSESVARGFSGSLKSGGEAKTKVVHK
jgi:xanthine dehydrogenase large subunit